MTATSSSLKHSVLAVANWWPGNHAALEALLAMPDLATRSAVFDWDNTCIHNDLGDAAFRWQLDHLQLALPPHLVEAQWAAPLRLLEQAGAPVQQATHLYQDVTAAWRQLWPSVVQGRGEGARLSPAHLDLRCKWTALYDQLLRQGSEVAEVVPCVFGLLAQLWGGLPTTAPASCVAALTAGGMQALPRQESWTPASAGAAGDEPTTFSSGLRPLAEVQSLMAALADRGVRLAVVSASFEPLVQALAAAWSYPVQASAIFGLRLEPAEPPEPCAPERFATQLRRNYPLTYRAGKVSCIEQHQLGSPILVAGDALTDLEMLTHWPATQIRLLLHRHNCAPEIAQLHQQALADAAKPFAWPAQQPRALLQGRNQVVGEFWPRQHSGPVA